MNDQDAPGPETEPRVGDTPPAKARTQARARQAIRQAKTTAHQDPQAQAEKSAFRTRLLQDLGVQNLGDLPPAIAETVEEAATRKVQRDALTAAVEKAEAQGRLTNTKRGTVSDLVAARDRQAEELLRLLQVLEDWKAKSRTASKPGIAQWLRSRGQVQPVTLPTPPTEAGSTPEPAVPPVDPPREEPKPEDPQKPRPSPCAPCALVGQRKCPHVAPPTSAPSESDPGPKIISPPDHQLGLPSGTIDKLIETARKTGRVKDLIQLCRRRDLDDDPEFAGQRRFDPPRVINLAGNPFGKRA